MAEPCELVRVGGRLDLAEGADQRAGPVLDLAEVPFLGRLAPLFGAVVRVHVVGVVLPYGQHELHVALSQFVHLRSGLRLSLTHTDAS